MTLLTLPKTRHDPGCCSSFRSQTEQNNTESSGPKLYRAQIPSPGVWVEMPTPPATESKLQGRVSTTLTPELERISRLIEQTKHSEKLRGKLGKPFITYIDKYRNSDQDLEKLAALFYPNGSEDFAKKLVQIKKIAHKLQVITESNLQGRVSTTLTPELKRISRLMAHEKHFENQRDKLYEKKSDMALDLFIELAKAENHVIPRDRYLEMRQAWFKCRYWHKKNDCAAKKISRKLDNRLTTYLDKYQNSDQDLEKLAALFYPYGSEDFVEKLEQIKAMAHTLQLITRHSGGLNNPEVQQMLREQEKAMRDGTLKLNES